MIELACRLKARPIASRGGGEQSLNTDQLSYFTVLYANRSFALAAKRIPITAQGLIRAIRRLETELDVPLFDIDDAGVPHPTPYADILNKYLLRWNRDWLSLQEQFARLKAQAIQEVRLGASMGVLGIFGSGFIEGFERAHPGITLNLKEFDDESLDKGLRNEFYDMAITLHPFDETLVTTELFSTAIGFWVPKDSQLAGRPSLCVADLAGQTLSWPPKSYKIYGTLMRLCREAGVQLGHIYESEQMFTIFNFVQEGKGLGFTLPQIAGIPVFSHIDAVACIPSSDITLRCGISYQPSHALTPSERHFYDYTVDYVRRCPKLAS